MRVKYRDGSETDLHVMHARSGFVAEQITITDADAKYLGVMRRNNPSEFMLYMEQFLARFPSNRV